MRLRDFLEIDFILFVAAIVLMVIGVLFIYSSGITSEGILISNEYRRQILWGAAGFGLALIITMMNYRRIYDLSVYLYLGTIVLLLATIVMGRLGFGTRWLRIGVFSFQASEFAKITTILFMAWYLDNTKRNQAVFSRFLVSSLIALIPMGLILIQPDLGTALVFIPILVGMTYIAGISARYIGFLVLTIVLTGIFLVIPLWQSIIMRNAYPALMMLHNSRFITAICLALSAIVAIALVGFIRYHKRYFYWICYVAGIFILALGTSLAAQKILKEYQIMRLIVFMNPNVDPRGSGWHIIQSITAIGSGGAFGRGFLQGTHSHYRYLPEQSTDFIFSILSEEWGFIGGILVFTLFLVITLRLIRIMRITADTYGSYIAGGLTSMFAFHFIINIGMTMGIMPITGIPLLFVSYGGSALVTAMVGIGLAQSIHVRKYLY